MKCPTCGHDEMRVTDSRPSEQNTIRRRRRCQRCRQRITTYEQIGEGGAENKPAAFPWLAGIYWRLRPQDRVVLRRVAIGLLRVPAEDDPDVGAA